MDEELDCAWRAGSETMLAEVKQWRAAHPKATFQELEQAVHERMSRLEAQVLQGAALASKASDGATHQSKTTRVALPVGRACSHEASMLGT